MPLYLRLQRNRASLHPQIQRRPPDAVSAFPLPARHRGGFNEAKLIGFVHSVNYESVTAVTMLQLLQVN